VPLAGRAGVIRFAHLTGLDRVGAAAVLAIWPNGATLSSAAARARTRVFGAGFREPGGAGTVSAGHAILGNHIGLIGKWQKSACEIGM